ncbi:MAG: hypothetical protein HYX77_03375 [Acidobacteria bacterium]|nr:hypothetical protein [Acidobacteriota bacterium]
MNDTGCCKSMMRCLFPDTPRDFPLRRAVRTALRTLHILATGVLVGGHIFGQPKEQLFGWLVGSVASGVVLLATDLHATFAFLLQVRGLLVLLKVVLTASLFFFWEAGVPLLVAALTLGAAGSHMPGSVRHRLVLGRGMFVGDERNG